MSDLFNNFDTSEVITEEEKKICLKVLRTIKDKLHKEYLDAYMKRDCDLADTKLWEMNNIDCADLLIDTCW
jgi:N-acetylmuramoyl-L-alanine amidase